MSIPRMQGKIRIIFYNLKLSQQRWVTKNWYTVLFHHHHHQHIRNNLIIRYCTTTTKIVYTAIKWQYSLYHSKQSSHYICKMAMKVGIHVLRAATLHAMVSELKVCKTELKKKPCLPIKMHGMCTWMNALDWQLVYIEDKACWLH